MKYTKSILFALFISLLFSCSSDDGDSNPTSNNDPEDPDDPVLYYSISGTVTDQEGELIEGYTVYLHGDKEDSTVTNSEGFYSFDNLTSGYYTIPISISQSRVFNPLTSDETVNISIKVYKQITISGTIMDLEGNPVEGVPIIFEFLSSSDGDKIENASDAAGYYEFDVELHPDTWGWEIKLNSFEHRYRSKSQDTEVGTGTDRASDKYRSTDVVIDFEQLEDIRTQWRAEGNNVSAAASESGAVESLLDILDDDMAYVWYYVDSDNQTHSYGFNKPFTITKSPSGSIHAIALEGDDANYEGIYEITKADGTWTLKLEVVNTTDGNTPPTVQGGFGSSNNGADGTDYVWRFTYERDI